MTQAQALQFGQRSLYLGKGFRILARGFQDELFAAAQDDALAPAVETFDDGPGDGGNGDQVLGGLDTDTLHGSVIRKS